MMRTRLTVVLLGILSLVLPTNGYPLRKNDAADRPAASGDPPRTTRLRPRPVPSQNTEPDVASALTACSSVTEEQRAVELRTFEAFNDERKKANLPALVWSDRVAELARDHSCRMVAAGFFSHEDPELGGVKQRLDRAGIPWRSYSENVFRIKDSPDCVASAMEEWLASVYHRTNILSTTSTTVGVGMATDGDDECYFTAIFLAQMLVLAVPGQADNPTCALQADHTRVYPGDPVKLDWTVADDATVSLMVDAKDGKEIASGKGSGTHVDNPTRFTKYKLVVTDAKGKTTTCSISVDVKACELKAEPARVDKPGDPVKLSWKVTDPNVEVTIFDETGEVKGLQKMPPVGSGEARPTKKTTYRLKWRPKGAADRDPWKVCEEQVTVFAGAPPTCHLEEHVKKATATKATITWSTKNAVSGQMEAFKYDPQLKQWVVLPLQRGQFDFAKGSMEVDTEIKSGTKTYDRMYYRLTVTNATGEKGECFVVIDSGCSLQATPSKNPKPGDAVTLKWSAPGAADATVTPDPGKLASGDLPAGSKDVNPSQSTVYKLTRTPARGKDGCNACVTVLGGAKAVGSNTLNIPPKIQQLSNWCWLAVDEMIFNFLGIPNRDPTMSYQCSLIKFVYPQCAANCAQCNVGGSTQKTMMDLLAKYPVTDPKTTSPVRSIHTKGPLTPAQIKAEIDGKRPIIAGVSPFTNIPNKPVSDHVALIIGYVESGGKTYLIVNDPYPYDPTNYPNPFGKAGAWNNKDGSYCVEYDAFVKYLVWNETFYGIAQ
jgi:uncharacterized protein YkwD